MALGRPTQTFKDDRLLANVNLLSPLPMYVVNR